VRYLSFDIEATGLKENDYMIEFGMVPFCTESKTLEEDLSFHSFIKCPSFSDLLPHLDKWVRDNNKTLIETAHKSGIELDAFNLAFKDYFENKKVIDYFSHNEKIIPSLDNKKSDKRIPLFGKSMNSIDLPFMSRDVGWDYMRDKFHHQNLDLSTVVRCLIDLNLLGPEMISGSELMRYLALGEVSHTALEDARNTAIMYLKLLDLFKS
jgi:hypothetical protein